MRLKKFLTILLVEKIGAGLTKLSPWLNTQYSSFIFTLKFLNLSNPKTFAEKISWLKINRYAKDPLVMQCADKLAVRKFVEQKGFGYMLNDLIAIYKNVDEIKWNELPQAFVLKWNFGSGYNYLCKHNTYLDIVDAKQKLNKWGQKKFWLFFSELHYAIAKKRIICERFLDTTSGSLIDYKFYCFHGKVKAVLVLERVGNEAERAVFMAPDWSYISDVNYKYKNTFLPKKPVSLEEMIKAAEELSSSFPFVRIDFYEWNGKSIFGEMTFTPAAGILPSETMIDGKQMGEFIIL